MTHGAGKYDLECTAVLEATDAQTTVVIVVDGDRGTGFSLSSVRPEDMVRLPTLLRFVADTIERDMRGGA